MKKILIIDDKGENLHTIKALITELFSGFVTITASSGAEGLEMAKSQNPDVILLDTLMSGMDGFEVCRILKDDKTLCDIPVVLVAALMENKQHKIRALEAGADGFLTKPSDKEEFIFCLNAMLKIREANDFKKSEKQRLERMASVRTRELQDKEWQHREALAMPHVGYWSLDLQTNSLQWSDEVNRIFDIEPAESPVTYEAFLHRVHPQDRDFVDAAFRTSVQKRIPYDIEHRVLFNDGSVKYITERCVTYYDDQGNPTRSIGTVMDITGRRQAEEKLRQNHHMLDTILNTIPQSVFWKDINSRYLGCNSQFAKAVGLDSPEDIVGKTDFDLPWPKKDAEAYLADDRLVMDHNSPKSHIIEPLQQANGNRLWIDTTKMPLHDSNGSVYGVLGVYEDITERIQSEKELQIKNWAIESSINAIAIADLEGNLTYVNSSFLKLWGYPENTDVIGRSSIEFWQNRSNPIAVIKALETNGYWQGEMMAERSDGSVFSTEVSACLIKDTDGFPICMQASFIDVTGRKEAEEALQQAGHVLLNMQIGLFVYELENPDDDYTLRMVAANPSSKKLSGVSAEELIGKYIDEIFPYLRAKGIPKRFADVVRTGIAGEFEDFYYSDDGVLESAFAVKAFPLPNQRVGITFDNITERKRTEEELIKAKEKAEESQRKFKAIADTSPLAIYISKGIRQVAEYINPTFYKLFGYTYNEVSEVALWWPLAYPDPEYQKQVSEEWNSKVEIAIRSKSDIEPMEVIVTCKDGSIKNIMWGFVSTGDENWAFGMDLTAYRKTEQEMVAAKEKAEESDRLKSAFLANMSHEIRTPMNGILGFAELLKEPGLTGAEQQKYIGIIERSGKRMLNIINDIVDISKIEAGLVELHFTESNINEQIEYITSFFKPEAETKGLKLMVKNVLEPDETTLSTDREKLYAILTNLVKNAIKYTHKGEISLGCTHKGEFLEFYVKDTGIGIPEDRQQAIFERFIQADIEDKMAYQGAGLGLSISKSFVEMLGGKIWVESEEGKGSVFYFTIPYNTRAESENVIPKEVAAESKSGIRKLKILVVEDDETSEILLDTTIQKFSTEILIARTGVEAVEMARNNSDIDLILMDILMPVMGGHEATRRIRQFNKDVVIIAQTAYGLTGDKEKAINAGCNDYISKPIDKAELLTLMRKYFGE